MAGRKNNRSNSTSRNSKPTAAPSNTSNNQVAKPGMMSGVMSAMFTGMAFGAGAELIRGLFRGEGQNILKFIASGGAGFLAFKVMSSTKYSKLKIPVAIGTTAGTYMWLNNENQLI